MTEPKPKRPGKTSVEERYRRNRPGSGNGPRKFTTYSADLLRLWLEALANPGREVTIINFADEKKKEATQKMSRRLNLSARFYPSDVCAQAMVGKKMTCKAAPTGVPGYYRLYFIAQQIDLTEIVECLKNTS